MVTVKLLKAELNRANIKVPASELEAYSDLCEALDRNSQIYT